MKKLLAVVLSLLLIDCAIVTKPCSTPNPGPGWVCVGGLWYNYGPQDPTPTPAPTVPPTPVPTPTPSPTPPPPLPAACVTPSWGPGLGRVAATRAEAVDAAVGVVRADWPELFVDDLIADWATQGSANAALFYRLVVAELVSKGYCAWAMGSHELQIVNEAGRGEGYHIINHARGKVWDAANAYAGDTVILAATPAPTPAPAPVCRLAPDPQRLRAKARIRIDASRYADVTFEYYYGVKEDGTPAGLCGRRWCDLGVDGGEDGAACAEPLIGTPQWEVIRGTNRNLEIWPGFKGNPYFCKVEGRGLLRVCSEKVPASCVDLEVP